MSFLFGTQGQSSPPNKRLGLFDSSTATNEQANPLPYLAGKRRFAGTFISDAFDQQTSSQSSGGKDSGKGGGGSGTNYYAGFLVAFCLGPCDGFHDLFLNGDDVYVSNSPIKPTTLSQAGNLATFFKSGGHGLPVGAANVVMLINGADQPEFNGQFTVAIPDPYRFTYVIPGSTILAETASGQILAYEKLNSIYRGAEDFITVTIPNYGTMTLFWGTETQPPSGYAAFSGTNHPPYHGICYAVFQKFFLGLNQTNIQNIEIVLSRTPTAPWLNNPADANINDEANAAVVYYDLLTHPRCGLGLTAGDFNTAALATAATRLATEGLGISPIITSEDTAQTLAVKLFESVDAMPILDPTSQLLSLQLVRAPANYGALPAVGDAQLADIPKLKASDWSNVFNETRIVFPNKDAAWNSDFVEWKDFASLLLGQKTAQPQTLQRDFVTDRAVATMLVKAAGLIGSAPPQTGTLSLLFSVALWNSLAPGNLFTLAYSLRPNQGGIFRVTKRTWQDSAKPVFEIEYAADRSYLNADL